MTNLAPKQTKHLTLYIPCGILVSVERNTRHKGDQKMRTLLTVDELKEQTMKQAIEAGVMLSRYCRNCWTGERTRPCISAVKITHWTSLVSIAINGRGKALLDFADTADLHKIIYLGRPDQHTWNATRWEQELRAKV